MPYNEFFNNPSSICRLARVYMLSADTRQLTITTEGYIHMCHV